MDENYRVIGTVQSCVNGEWFERSINAGVYAVDREHAKESILALYERAARHQDAYAIVRWYTPNLVRVYSI